MEAVIKFLEQAAAVIIFVIALSLFLSGIQMLDGFCKSFVGSRGYQELITMGVHEL